MRPILFAVDDSPSGLDDVERDLRKRYGADYEVVGDHSPTAALERLAGHEQVALLLAKQWMREMTGVEFLTRAHRLHPGAKRVLLIDVGDISAEQPISRALTLNHLDFYVGRPWATPEEEFYPVTGEALSLWAREHLPRYEKVKIIDKRQSARARRLQVYLEANNVVCGLYAVDSPEGRELLAANSLDAGRLPALILWNGQCLVEPNEEELAGALGAKTTPDEGRYDVVIIGSGPAGLAAAVYGASEGLRVVVVERESVGGQAGTSPAIHNYLGFPWGVSGRDLTERATRQATRFGASFVVAQSAIGLRTDRSDRVVSLSNGSEVSSRALIIATGVSYRTLEAPGIDSLLGAGIFYGAPTLGTQAFRGERVYLAGAGNSAGEAAVHLSTYAAHVTMLVRGTSLAKSMSDYLLRVIEATPNIDVRVSTEVAGAQGTYDLESLVLRDRETGAMETVAAGALFILIGAEAHTEWLAGVVARDRQGYILTGRDLTSDVLNAEDWPQERRPSLLETSLPGVFAVGDVRHRSIKRVASAAGEGATAIKIIHEYLGEA